MQVIFNGVDIEAYENGVHGAVKRSDLNIPEDVFVVGMVGRVSPQKITGWVDNPMSYVELFDVACLLSRWEGFGLALPEYMMAGKTIVASRADAIPNIIRDGENGLLVEVDNAVGASEAVLWFYQDYGLKSRLVAHGLKDVKNRFDVKRVSLEHQRLFKNITNKD